MHKSIAALLAAAVLAANLVGCKASQVPQSPSEAASLPTFTEIIETEPTVPTRERRMEAYRAALETFAKDGMTPTGDAVWYDDGAFGAMEDNLFTIADVDGDGEEELVILFSTAPMAGMRGWVYGFDEETDSLYEELSAFPALEFYTGGLVEAGWSHNHGLGGKLLWPYTLMGYNPAARSYEVIAHIDSWDKEIPTETPFPTDIDTEDVGTVFLLTQQDSTETLSLAQYEAWRETVYGSAEKIPLDYHELTAENIQAQTAQ